MKVERWVTFTAESLMDDDELHRRARRGELTSKEVGDLSRQLSDPTAFNLLVSHYWGQLHSKAEWLLGSADDADDVVQETYMKAFRSRRSYVPTERAGQFSGWVHAIMLNCIRDLVGDRVRKETAAVAAAEMSRNFHPGPDREVEARRRLEQIDAAMSSVSQRYRQVFLLRYFEELSYTEIEERVGVPERTARRWCMQVWKLLEELGLLPPSTGRGSVGDVA